MEIAQPGHQLNLSDAIRLAQRDEAFAHALLARPHTFAQLFNLRHHQIAALGGAPRSGGVQVALESVRRDLEQSAPSPDDGVLLGLQDALRLAAADEEFAAALFSSPESFRQGFNLTEAEVNAIGAAQDGDTIEEALEKLGNGLSGGDAAGNRGESSLDAADVMRLATADERFGLALQQSPDRFRQSFNLTDGEVQTIAKTVGVAGRPAVG